jgi:uridylate kinase
MTSESLRYQRILLKLSGQALGGNAGDGFDPKRVLSICGHIVKAQKTGAQIGIVVGGGNFFRGAEDSGLPLNRTDADQIGMLATTMNSLCLGGVLENLGVKTSVLSSFDAPSLCDPFRSDKARELLSEGVVVIFAGGTGNPFFTTDSASALKALEIDADIMVKATRVDGLYSADPEIDKNAVKYDHLTYDEVLSRKLKALDTTAFALLRENNLPMVILDIEEEDAILRLLRGEKIGSLITTDEQE